MSSHSFKWLLVRWKNGGCDVVDIASVVRSSDMEPRLGDVITVTRRGEREMGTLIGRAQERYMLQAGPSWRYEAGPRRRYEAGPNRRYKAGPTSSQEAGPSTKYEEEADRDTLDAVTKESVKVEAGPNCKNESSSSSVEEAGDDSRSRSSRDSSHDEDISIGSDAEATLLKMNPHPSTRAGQNNCERLFLRNLNLNEMREFDESEIEAVINQTNVHFENVLNIIDDLKRQMSKKQKSKKHKKKLKAVKAIKSNKKQSVEEDMKEYSEENSEYEDQNDNILMSNDAETDEDVELDDEWMPIGSGKTLVHKAKLKRVNWTSYITATRTLLVAVFPRRILATHSLTGKRSPSFKHKPPKMCLAQKVTSDVIMEIMDTYDVRENLVRSIIIKKCADEHEKMKMRTKKKKPKNDENMAPDTNIVCARLKEMNISKNVLETK